MNEIIQLKITLENSKPAIWRRVRVKGQTTFFELHHIIQIVFGWQNYHAYEFYIDNHKLGAPDDYMKNVPATEEGVIDARDITLDSLIVQQRETFKYEYDFGDSWMHRVVVERFLREEESMIYPYCMSGKYACPPEDCGGFRGYYNMLEILKDKKHPEYKDLKKWVGNNFDPDYFNVEQVNQKLLRLDKYIMDWLNS